ncbi:polycomb group RING finger protein 6-like [Mizuhopecten yessoensis]|uniref:Polycomb group RING finger protein 6 n=1 Tax=Mizuhopecten yessoensis TaxID=6573 RepID=A0A210PYB0_MIZYE|nr:polycomb group RING finger protein 6-like [Mizuhopecten yessoensis]OWF41464.1 Polycomb group RING finger protein 6 [Mizuhopecten yessoensis]
MEEDVPEEAPVHNTSEHEEAPAAPREDLDTLSCNSSKDSKDFLVPKIKTEDQSTSDNTSLPLQEENPLSTSDNTQEPLPAAKVTSLRDQLSLLPESPSRRKEPINVQLRDINPYITCGLCGGYLYEASTITECMHSFCKTCIVRHTERHLNCPSCDAAIHPTDPFVHIRNDSTIQDIVYRLLPHIAEEEQRREKLFYEEHEKATGEQITPKLTLPPPPPRTPPPNSIPPMPVKPLPRKAESHKHRNLGNFKSQFVSLFLEYIGDLDEFGDQLTLAKNFLRVAGKATIGNLISFIRKKLYLTTHCNVDIFLTHDSDTTLMTTDNKLLNIREEFYQGQDCIVELQYRVSTNLDD